MWWHDGWSTWNWFFMMLSMALFWTVVIGAVVWAIRSSRTTRSGPPPHASSARDVLDERFARGEISEDEYRQAREALSER